MAVGLQALVGTAVGAIQGSYNLSQVVSAPIAGFLSDRCGRKPVMVRGYCRIRISPRRRLSLSRRDDDDGRRHALERAARRPARARSARAFGGGVAPTHSPDARDNRCQLYTHTHTHTHAHTRRLPSPRQVVGLVAMAAGTGAFGFAESLAAAVALRFGVGLLNNNLALTKAYLGDLAVAAGCKKGARGHRGVGGRTRLATTDSSSCSR